MLQSIHKARPPNRNIEKNTAYKNVCMTIIISLYIKLITIIRTNAIDYFRQLFSFQLLKCIRYTFINASVSTWSSWLTLLMLLWLIGSKKGRGLVRRSLEKNSLLWYSENYDLLTWAGSKWKHSLKIWDVLIQKHWKCKVALWLNLTWVHQDKIAHIRKFDVSMYLPTAGTRKRTICTALVIK